MGADAIFKLLRDGGLVGALSLALVVVGYLFIKLHDVWQQRAADAEAEAKEFQKALIAEKDEHRQTSMTIVGLAQDLARLLEKQQNERKTYGARRGASPGSGGVGAGGGSGPGPAPARPAKGSGGPGEEDGGSGSPDGQTGAGGSGG